MRFKYFRTLALCWNRTLCVSDLLYLMYFTSSIVTNINQALEQQQARVLSTLGLVIEHKASVPN